MYQTFCVIIKPFRFTHSTCPHNLLYLNMTFILSPSLSPIYSSQEVWKNDVPSLPSGASEDESNQNSLRRKVFVRNSVKDFRNFVGRKFVRFGRHQRLSSSHLPKQVLHNQRRGCRADTERVDGSKSSSGAQRKRGRRREEKEEVSFTAQTSR